MSFVLLLMAANVLLFLGHCMAYSRKSELNSDLSDVLPPLSGEARRRLEQIREKARDEKGKAAEQGARPWESAAWANDLLSAAWERIRPAASVPLAHFLANDVFPTVELPFLKRLYLKNLDFGEVPPLVTAVRGAPDDPNGEAAMDVQVVWDGKPTVVFTAEVAVGDGAFSIDISIVDVQLSGVLRINTGAMLPKLPILRTLRFSLLPGYDLKFGVTVPRVLGTQTDVLQTLPKLAPTIMAAVKGAVGDHMLHPRFAEWQLPVHGSAEDNASRMEPRPTQAPPPPPPPPTVLRDEVHLNKTSGATVRFRFGGRQR